MSRLQSVRHKSKTEDNTTTTTTTTSKMFKIYKCNSLEWKPTAVVALATSSDGSKVAAARADGALEIWLASPGSVGWHCQLTIHGEVDSTATSLVWCRSGRRDGQLGRLFSSSIDGSVYEWDLFDLTQKRVLDSINVSIWQIAVQPRDDLQSNSELETKPYQNGHASPPIQSDIDEEESSSEDEDDGKAVQLHDEDDSRSTRLAVACDDGCVRIYSIHDDDDTLTYTRTLPRVSGRTLSVAWSPDASRIYSGSSDGFIRCWDAVLAHEIYRITVGSAGLGTGSDLCIWSLLALRGGDVVSGDSSGCVQFWDGRFGTLLQAHSYHKGDVNALVASPNHNRVFSGGSDGQVALYKLSGDASGSNDVNRQSGAMKKWNYVTSSSKTHTHDVKAMTIAVPISHEDLPPDEKVKRLRGKAKALDSSYHKWAHLGVPMLISGGDDTKLFAYPVREFTEFKPHDICPAPQRMPMKLVSQTISKQRPLLLVQASQSVDILCVSEKEGPSGGIANAELAARVRCKRKIICSAISPSGLSLSYSDNFKPVLFEFETRKSSKRSWKLIKRKLPPEIPYAHSMIYSSDSTQLILAGCDRRIYVVDVGSLMLIHTFTPSRRDGGDELPPVEPPITKMFTSSDGQWLAAINCFGDLYVYNLETVRQHWFVSRLDGASVTAAGFTPQNSNILIVSTSSNHVYALDVDAKKFGDWSMEHTYTLPLRYREFTGGVTGLSFPPSSSSSPVIIYGPRSLCLIDFGKPVDRDTDAKPVDRDTDTKPVDRDTDASLPNGHGLAGKPHSNGGLKRKRELEGKHSRKNFDMQSHRNPVLFVDYLSNNSLLVVEKPWPQVLKTLDTQPVHRHIYGT